VNTYEELKAHHAKGGVLVLNLTGVRGNLCGPRVTKIADKDPNVIPVFDDDVFFYCTTPDGVNRFFRAPRGIVGHFVEVVIDSIEGVEELLS
jgi:hypothetical protein